MRIGPFRNKKAEKESKRKRKPINSKQKLINRLGRRILKENRDNLHIRAAVMSKYLGIPFNVDDFSGESLKERLEKIMAEAIKKDLKSTDPIIRQQAFEYAKRLSAEGQEDPMMPAPPLVWERRRRGRPRKRIT